MSWRTALVLPPVDMVVVNIVLRGHVRGKTEGYIRG